MKIFNCEQGSEEWKRIRRGVLTASRAKESLTRGRGKGVDFGQSAISLVYELIAERMTGKSTHIENDATRWGNDYEPEAKRIYQERTGLIVENVGFGLSDESDLVGCSPDFYKKSCKTFS